MKWLTVTEAADYLGVSRPTLYRLVRSGELVAHRIAGKGTMRFRQEDLDAVMKPIDSAMGDPSHEH